MNSTTRKRLRGRLVSRCATVLALAALLAMPAVASAAGYSDTYGGHLHSSGYLYVDDHGDHTYNVNFARYGGAGTAAPLYSYFWYTSGGTPAHEGIDYGGKWATSCAFADCGENRGTLYNVGMAQYSGYAHTLDGFASA